MNKTLLLHNVFEDTISMISLKKYIGLFLVVVLSMAITYQIMPTKATSNTIVYEGSNENFLNPERGFYVSIDPEYQIPAPPLELPYLQGVKNYYNVSTIRRYYLLSEFRENPTISQSYLDMISNDCEVLRQAGMKMIVRFTYNWLGGGPDASRDIILSHIEQLKPILQANYDVIAYMEAGFIGYWGEWHTSSNEHINPLDGHITDSARTIFLKILSALPKERMVAIRYYFHKQQIFNNDALTFEEAFSGSDRARTGHHNDAFLYNINDWGTYTGEDADTVDKEKEWLSQDSKYLVNGGEPAAVSQILGYDDCAGALTDFELMHWDGMSMNQPGTEQMLQDWRDEGCMEEIQRRFGYRFRLVKSQTSSVVEPNGTFSMNLEIANDGFSNPYNPRGVEVILRNSSGDEYYLPLSEDPRRWMLGEIKTINVTAGVPEGIAPGKYQLLLNLPDPTSKLYNRPEYSIRLANQNLWEESTGYNSLLTSVNVVPNEGETYSGNQFFQKR